MATGQIGLLGVAHDMLAFACCNSVKTDTKMIASNGVDLQRTLKAVFVAFSKLRHIVRRILRLQSHTHIHITQANSASYPH